MKEFDWNGFENGKFAVNCKTENEANNFLMECETKGYRWMSNSKPTDSNNYEIYEISTVYHGKRKELTYGSSEQCAIEILGWSDYMNKELNIIEAIAMPVGTEFEVIHDNGRINGSKAILGIDYDFKSLKWDNGEYLNLTSKNLNAKFIPIPKPVSFMEAVKSGKYIRVDLTGIEGYGEKTIKELNTYMSLDEIFELLGNEFYGGYIKEIIEKGKWYIED